MLLYAVIACEYKKCIYCIYENLLDEIGGFLSVGLSEQQQVVAYDFAK